MSSMFKLSSPKALAAAISACAVTNPSLAASELEVIEVVGKDTNSLITPLELEKYQANDLSDIFRHIPSVSVGGSVGIAQKIYIRGVEDTLLNVTVDGAPQTGTLFHHIGRVSVEPELLQQVEVQAGAGEATSGAGAIGGAIRFKTKSAEDLLDEDADVGGLIKGGYFSNEGYKGSVSVFGRLNDDWGLLASYVYLDQENFEDGDGQETFGTSAEQTLGFMKLNGRLGDHELLFSYELRQEEGDFSARPNWPTLQDTPLIPSEAQRDTAVFSHRYSNEGLVNLESSIYYTKAEFTQLRTNRWGAYGAELASWGFDIRNTSKFADHTMSYGVDFRSDEVKSQYLADVSVWGPFAWDPSIGSFREEGDVLGVYWQDHWQLSEQLLLSVGARYDEYDVEQITYGEQTDSSGVSPNIGLQYEFAEHWQLRIGYAEAMRGKEIGDAFTLEKRPGRSSFQPGLEAEEVNNNELGLSYNDGQLSFKAAIYQMNIDNVILDQLGSGPAPQDSSYYENVGELEADGFELSLAYQWQRVALQVSYSQNDSELNGDTVEGYEHIGLANASGDRWNSNLSFNLSENVELGWNFTHVADLNNIEVLQRAVSLGWIDQTQSVNKPSYSVHDIYLQWMPMASEQLIINLAVQNVFDEQYRDHASVADYNHIPDWGGVAGLYEQGRDVRLTASYQF